jgi:hypothetical protein
LEEREQEIVELRAGLAAGVGTEGVQPENIVWMFGTGRTGSTWLASMMEGLENCAVWHEPLVGELFGHLYYVRANERHRRNKHFILGRDRQAWLASVKEFVLAGASARFPEISGGGHLVVKEPNGSIGAPLLMEALPESRMIFLVRDPRDVVASVVDANKKGSWVSERRGGSNAKVDENPQAFVAQRANIYLRDVENTKRAYDAHEGPKVLVKYEDLRANALSEMKRLHTTLGMSVDEEELARVVGEHAWESIPEEKKGEGRFYRKASPGSWREDLTSEQAETVERITAPLLKELYPV